MVLVRTSSRTTAAYLAVVDRIVAANRQPTPWEAGCLFAALCAMSLGDIEGAKHRIALAASASLSREPPATVVPTPTVRDLRQALETVLARTDRL